MAEKAEKNKSGAGKFFLGAALGALAGAVAGRFVKLKMDNDEEETCPCGCKEECVCDGNCTEECDQCGCKGGKAEAEKIAKKAEAKAKAEKPAEKKPAEK